MNTQILTHNTQEPPMEPPIISRESIVRAYADNCIERARLGIPMLPTPIVDADGWRLTMAVGTLDYLCKEFGFDYVQFWLDKLRESEKGVQ